MVSLDIRKIVIALLVSLVMLTIVSSLLTKYFDIPQVKTGLYFWLVFGIVFVTYLFVVAEKGALDKGEIITIIVLAVVLIGLGIGMKIYFPDLFSAMPDGFKQVFSAISP